MPDILINARNIWPQHVEANSSADINIEIYPDTVYGFIGPNSSLISAWLQTLAAIEPPASGELHFMGENTANPDRDHWQKLRLNLAYLNHRSALLSVLSTQENILLPALYHQLASRQDLLDQMLVLLQKIGFTDMDNLNSLPAYIDEISYTQAMLVRTVLTRPRVIVIDNALRHFDERTFRKMLNFLREYMESTHATLLLHDDNAEFIINNFKNIIFADNGCLLQFNDQTDFQSSDNRHVLQFLHDLATP
jgi:ABC-type transporter Mla maintaining outer membrane lipid asymmetry ATPase subunit MlaF